MNVNEFPIEYLKTINLLNIFFASSKEWRIEKYIEQCENLIQCLERSSEEEIYSWEIAYVSNRDLIYMKESLVGEDDEKKVAQFTSLVYHNYAFKEKIVERDDLYAEQVNRIEEAVEDYYFDRMKRKEQDYYKNLFDEEYYADYENVLSLISNNLKMFDMNLVYCRKIVDFLTNEFNKKGIYIMQTMFLNNYLSNAVDSMILTICKMILDNPDTNNKRNCGLMYLQSYIGKNLSEGSRDIVQGRLKKASDKIKELRKMTTKLEDLRNSLIAHFDINKIESVKQIKMGIEEFEKVFELLCEILELFSMKYFLYENSFSCKMITTHGFKYYVCQNPILHSKTIDLDMYFDILRKDFIKVV